ncbi:penicillin acylase family protein [Aeromicrobium sp. CTD01-1L150]|uniref:penicillin acylase family protein n=1 Tax=Aeromicrobium sp. CTD01-1L150 TaxID=3341830 RepID=UPI0035C1071C
MTVLDVRGESVTALGFAQGRQTASARGRQLESDRRHVESASGGPWDEFARRAMLATTARLAFERLDRESAAFVAAYAEGVDAGLRPGDRARGSWQPWTPLAIFAMHHALFGSMGHQLWRRHVARTLGPAAVPALAHEAPAVTGSNAFVVGGERTASGLPLIGADPHRILSVPGIYQQVRLRTDDFDVVGLTIAGVPGVQHFGHTGGVAWAVTNAMADTQDLLDVRLRPSGDGDVEVDLGLGWESCDVDGDVIATRLGPVVLGGPDRGSALVLRTTPWVARDLGFGALLPLLRARTADDVSAALERWVDPVNDVVIADTGGTALRRVAGLVPRRVDGDWIGWVEPAAQAVPSDGFVVSANQRRGRGEEHRRESRSGGADFAPPHRARRLEELLADRGGLEVADAAEILVDTVLLPAVHWQDRLREVATTSEAAEALRVRLLGWDRRMDTGSVGAAAFAAVRSALVALLADDPALSALRAESGLPALFDPWLAVEPRIALALDRWMTDGAPFGLDLVALLGRSVHDVAARGHAQTWGGTHVFRPEVGEAVALGGDENCVLSTSSLPGITDEVWRGPVARLVWSLADRSESRWTVPDDLCVWAADGTSAVGQP